MPEKPATAIGYPPQQAARVKATCLYLATKLGDLMPELVVVGGLVPSLLIDQHNLQDLFYMLRNYGSGISDVAAELRPLLSDASAVKAMEYLRMDFQENASIGPSRVAEFLYGRSDAATQADAVGFV